MPITTNAELITAFDNDDAIQAPKMLSPQPGNAMEHACQCIAIEVLRTLIDSGLTVQEYNDLESAAWDAIISESVARAELVTTAPVAACFAAHPGVGGNYGGNYFEHGYSTVIAGIQPGDTCVFTRTGGVQ